MGSRPGWYGQADAWFKLLAAIAVGYLILGELVRIVRDFADVSIVLIGGIFLAYFVYPIISWLNKRLPLWAALTIVYGGGFVAIVLALVFLVPTAVGQFQGLVADLPRMQTKIEAFLANPRNPLLSHFPDAMRSYVQKLPGQVTHDLQLHAAAYTSKVVNALILIVGVAAMAIAIPVVSIYMLAESAMIKRFFVQGFQPDRRQTVVAFLRDCDDVVGGFVRGQVIVAAVVGALAIGALLILGIPYAVVIGAWAGIADIIPYIGPFAGAIPAAIVALIEKGPLSMVWVAVAFTIINQLEGHILGPRIVSSTVKITPLAVIFALLIGAHLFGLAGLIVAVPLAGLIRVVLVRLFPDREVTNAELRPGLTHPPKPDVDPAATEA